MWHCCWNFILVVLPDTCVCAPAAWPDCMFALPGNIAMCHKKSGDHDCNRLEFLERRLQAVCACHLASNRVYMVPHVKKKRDKYVQSHTTDGRKPQVVTVGTVATAKFKYMSLSCGGEILQLKIATWRISQKTFLHTALNVLQFLLDPQRLCQRDVLSPSASPQCVKRFLN